MRKKVKNTVVKVLRYGPPNRPRKGKKQALRRRAGGLVKNNSMALSPFFACTYSNIGTPTAGLGVPDGNSMQSIVIDHRQTFVITPVNSGGLNTIQFAICPGANGSFALQCGTMSATTLSVNPATGIVSGTFSGNFTATPAFLTYSYGIFPFSEYASASSTGESINLDAPNVGRYVQGRLITNKARFAFSGSSLANEGVCAVGRQSIKANAPIATFDPLPLAIYGADRMLTTSTGPQTFTDVANLESSVIMSAAETRCGYDVLNVPYTYLYAPRLENASIIHFDPATVASLPSFGNVFWDGISSQGRAGASPNLYDAPSTFVTYSGVDSSSSVVVSIQSCVEYVVDYSSPVARFAKMGPPLDERSIQQVKSVSRSLPVTKPASTNWWTVASNVFRGLTGIVSKSLIGFNAWDAVDSLTGAIKGMAVDNSFGNREGGRKMFNYPIG